MSWTDLVEDVRNVIRQKLRDSTPLTRVALSLTCRVEYKGALVTRMWKRWHRRLPTQDNTNPGIVIDHFLDLALLEGDGRRFAARLLRPLYKEKPWALAFITQPFLQGNVAMAARLWRKFLHLCLLRKNIDSPLCKSELWLAWRVDESILKDALLMSAGRSGCLRLIRAMFREFQPDTEIKLYVPILVGAFRGSHFTLMDTLLDEHAQAADWLMENCFSHPAFPWSDAAFVDLAYYAAWPTFSAYLHDLYPSLPTIAKRSNARCIFNSIPGEPADVIFQRDYTPLGTVSLDRTARLISYDGGRTHFIIYEQ